jgi:hypothetical protein
MCTLNQIKKKRKVQGKEMKEREKKIKRRFVEDTLTDMIFFPGCTYQFSGFNGSNPFSLA